MNKFSKQSPIQMGIILNSDHYAASGIHAFNSSIKNRIIFSFTNADALATVPDGKSVVLAQIQLVVSIIHLKHFYI